jgi:hypothetical protein
MQQAALMSSSRLVKQTGLWLSATGPVFVRRRGPSLTRANRTAAAAACQAHAGATEKNADSLCTRPLAITDGRSPHLTDPERSWFCSELLHSRVRQMVRMVYTGFGRPARSC